MTNSGDCAAMPSGVLDVSFSLTTPASSSDMPRMIMPMLSAMTVACSSPADAESDGGPVSLMLLAVIGAVNGLLSLTARSE